MKTGPATDLVGRHIGHLTVVEFLGREPESGTRHWVCSCDCGRGDVVRTTAQLNSGHALYCRTCKRERRADLSSDVGRRFVFRRQWLRTHSLWNANDSERLAADVQRALVAEFGPTVETYTGPTTADADDEGRFGGRDGALCTLQHVADVLGCSRERARQLEQQALFKIAMGLYKVDPALFGGRPPRYHEIRSVAASVGGCFDERPRRRRTMPAPLTALAVEAA